MGKKLLKALLGTVGAIVTIGLFYIAVVLGQPQVDPEQVVVSQDQPLLTASPAVSLQSADQLDGMLQDFPAPMLHAVQDGGLTLVSGGSYDTAYGDGFARVAQLTYQMELDGQTIQLTVQSIYPARAIDLLPKADYRITRDANSLAGMTAVTMENADSIRIHVQAAEGIYAVTLPLSARDSVAEATRSLQLSILEEAP